MNTKTTAFNTMPERIPTDLRPGWTVRVYQKIKEGDKSRVQAFEGIIIAKKHGGEPGGTITVRRATGGFGVEKIYPLHLPTIDKIEVVKKTQRIRRSKLYYLRTRSAKEIRRKTKASSEKTASTKAETV